MITWDKDVGDARTKTDQPGKEDEVPVLQAGGYAIDLEELAKGRNIDV